MDGGFVCIRNNLADMGITLNVASRNEHVPEVERYIRTIKKRVRVYIDIQEEPTKFDSRNCLHRHTLVK